MFIPKFRGQKFCGIKQLHVIWSLCVGCGGIYVYFQTCKSVGFVTTPNFSYMYTVVVVSRSKDTHVEICNAGHIVTLWDRINFLYSHRSHTHPHPSPWQQTRRLAHLCPTDQRQGLWLWLGSVSNRGRAKLWRCEDKSGKRSKYRFAAVGWGWRRHPGWLWDEK